MKRGYKYFLIFATFIPCFIIGLGYDMDLVTFWVAGKHAFEDVSRVYSQNWDLGRFFYGPISLVILEPLGHLSYAAFKTLSMAFDSICYVVFWVYLFKLYPVLLRPSCILGWFVVWIVTINPIHHNFQSHNIQLILGALFVFSEYLTRQNRRWSQFFGGLLVALAGGVKLFPFFVAALYLVMKKKTVRIGVLSGVILTFVLPFLYFGISDGAFLFKSFLGSLTRFHDTNNLILKAEILSLPSLLARWFPPALGQEHLATTIQKILTIAISIGFFTFAWRERKSLLKYPRTDTHVWALSLVTLTFLNPSTRAHYFIFLVPAFCSLVEGYQSELAKIPRYFFGIGALVSMALIALTTDFVIGKNLNDQFEHWNVPTLGTFTLLVLCALYVGLGYQTDKTAT